jgi:hypothetical protein
MTSPATRAQLEKTTRAAHATDPAMPVNNKTQNTIDAIHRKSGYPAKLGHSRSSVKPVEKLDRATIRPTPR